MVRDPQPADQAELVQQDYDGFAATDIRNGGQFRGIAIEGVIAF
ncbi:MAG TPA: hypothetical protein VEQ60_11030 [Longimicrobium sp.]|nr:hypothetical protein [Longimicrobium sp.]